MLLMMKAHLGLGVGRGGGVDGGDLERVGVVHRATSRSRSLGADVLSNTLRDGLSHGRACQAEESDGGVHLEDDERNVNINYSG